MEKKTSDDRAPKVKAVRSRKLIKPRLQLELSLVFGGLSVLACLLMGLLFNSLLSQATSSMPQGGEYLVDLLPSIFAKAVLVAGGLVLPLTVGVGILMTFRVAGPVYRMEQHLRSVLRGETVRPCMIRKGDKFQELCDLINAVTVPAAAAPATAPAAASSSAASPARP